MKSKNAQKILPYAPADVFDLIMDVASYPVIFPLVKSARTLKKAASGDEVELVFDLPPVVPVSDPRHVARVTAQKPDWIKAARISGPLKAMDLHWTLKPTAQGCTDMTFRMDYDLSFGFLLNALVNTQIDDLIQKSLVRFEAHAAQTLRPVASNQNGPHGALKGGGQPVKGAGPARKP